MTIWVLAIVLLASCAGLGYRQGIIRVAISFFGILVAALLAVPLGGLIRPIMNAIWTKDPLLLWVLPPVIMFFVVSAIFKAIAVPVYRKVDVFMKYKAGDLKLALWERLDHRLGLCVGLLNGTAYLVLVAFLIFAASYWTTQVATSKEDPWTVRLLNTLGKDMEATGFSKVARSIDRLPAYYYKTADIVGLVYANPLLEARLGSYPAFLSLAERGEFQQLSGDTEFIRLRQGHSSVKEVLSHPQVQIILKSPDLLRNIWAKVTGNVDDLQNYLQTGLSPKYDSELILGRWNFNVNAALSDFLKSKPNVSAKEMQKVKQAIIGAFGEAKFLATTEKQAILKNVPQLGAGMAVGAPQQKIEGTWKAEGNNTYDLSFPNAGNITAVVEADRLIVKGTGVSMIFNRDY